MDYEKAREEAIIRKEELTARMNQIVAEANRLEKEKAQVARELTGLEQVVESLEFMTNEEVTLEPEPAGFTDHIRTILQRTTIPLTPVQIRDSCVAAGFAQKSLKNLLISVHTTLSRIESNLEKTQVEGKTAYRWKQIQTEVDPNFPHRRRLVNRPKHRTLDTKIKLMTLKK